MDRKFKSKRIWYKMLQEGLVKQQLEIIDGQFFLVVDGKIELNYEKSDDVLLDIKLQEDVKLFGLLDLLKDIFEDVLKLLQDDKLLEKDDIEIIDEIEIENEESGIEQKQEILGDVGKYLGGIFVSDVEDFLLS